MAMTAKLDEIEHDLIIKNGAIQYIAGQEEIQQRILVALRHYFGEYFFDRNSGLPWYQRILGMRNNYNSISNLIRDYVSAIEGVEYVERIDLNRVGRKYEIFLQVVIEGGELVTFNNIQVEVS